MAEVVALRGSAAVAQGHAEPKVIEVLEEWLAKAKAGEVVALGIIAVKPSSVVATVYLNLSHWLHHLISGSATLLHRLNAENESLD